MSPTSCKPHRTPRLHEPCLNGSRREDSRPGRGRFDWQIWVRFMFILSCSLQKAGQRLWVSPDTCPPPLLVFSGQLQSFFFCDCRELSICNLWKLVWLYNCLFEGKQFPTLQEHTQREERWEQHHFQQERLQERSDTGWESKSITKRQDITRQHITRERTFGVSYLISCLHINGSLLTC